MKPTFFIGEKLEGNTKDWLMQNALDFEEFPLIQIDFSIEAVGRSVNELFIQKEHNG